MIKKIKLATVFSGIGSVEFAFRRLGIPYEIVFACDNGEREINYDIEKEKNIVRNLQSIKDKKEYVDKLYNEKTRKHNFVEDSYLANYNLDKSKFYQDIVLLDGRDFLDKVDVFVGGSPCQSFSSIGFQKGLDDVRGTLFYEYARLISEIKPKVFIYENVRNIINHDNGNTWKIIKAVFDSLGYNLDYQILNAVDFNIPQKRNRLFVVGYKKCFNLLPNIKTSSNKILQYKMQDFLLNNCKFGNFNFSHKNGSLIVDLSCGDNIPDRYFLSSAVKTYVLKEGTKNWHQKVEIDLPIARTLLKTMGNCHRAGVDNYVTYNGKIRMLTEREALRLMGFTDDFKIVVSISQTYKQAGNSIVVDVMMQIINDIINSGILEEN